jgi:hypothetical protein
MIRRPLDFRFLQQQIKDPISLGDVKPVLLSTFLANKHETGSLFLVHFAKPISASSLESQESSIKATFI